MTRRPSCSHGSGLCFVALPQIIDGGAWRLNATQPKLVAAKS